MADFESIIKTYTGEDGSISAEATGKLAKAIGTAVGNEFVEKSRYKDKLEKIEELNGRLQTAEDSVTAASAWKEKYEALANDFEAYKGDQAKKEAYAAKEAAYRTILKEAGIGEKRVPTVLKVTDIDSLELTQKGELKGADKLLESAKSEWVDFIETTEIKGAETAFPPTNSGKNTMTREQIMEIKDASQRQQAIAQNMDLFGIK